ncbi:hypothetical protein H257_07712 [Aphanomyces astaci]|uniref:Uncharacterized protein n=1 Tax=Aphanomyces astaci TaxID=112090 RepID=W4GGW5_APHAT|nr:hypothetical protein H257_07712 [Aphanomyces astaci]ETV78922.1 hypothetical protein H257_07712 [Aphanomyces astaci]|eukprot:XP_009831641.1 hypothetical protein H257_07712 [Aphanomyces astaci]
MANSTKVLALKESDNVWAKMISPSFHLTIVAVASATGPTTGDLFKYPRTTISCFISTSKKRKSIDVGGRLITQDFFNEIIDDQPNRKKTKKPTKKSSKKNQFCPK